MTEALLLIWMGVTTSQTFSAIRYESPAQCELARTAIHEARWPYSWNHVPEPATQCVPVPRAKAEVLPR